MDQLLNVWLVGAGCDALALHLILTNGICSFNLPATALPVMGCICVMLPWVLAHWEEYHTGKRAGEGWPDVEGAPKGGHVVTAVPSSPVLGAPTGMPWQSVLVRCRRDRPLPSSPALLCSAGTMVYGNGVIGVTEANYAVVALHYAAVVLGPRGWRWHPFSLLVQPQLMRSVLPHPVVHFLEVLQVGHPPSGVGSACRCPMCLHGVPDVVD